VPVPTPEAASLPKLVYVYDPRSFAPLSITDAAEGICRFVWVVDFSKPGAASTARLLRKFGPVIDSSDRDLERVATAAREHDPVGVLSMHDADLLWTAELAELLQLPFHSPETALRLTDKCAQRAALATAGLAVPMVRVIGADAGAATVADLAATFTYPAVLKPRFGQESRNTLPIASGAELVATLEDLRGQPDWLAEDYVLEGFVPDATTEVGGPGFAGFVSVESVVENGRVEHAGISSRTPFRWPFRETGYCTPTALSPELADEVLRVAGEAAHALGVTVGCLHTEIKLTDDGPVVIEVNGRPGGGMSEMLERASGFSILRSALRLAVGDPVGLQGPVACSRIGYLLYVFPQTDVEWIDSVEGLPELRKVDGVEEIVLVRGPGQRIDWREGSEAHVFHLTGTTRDFDELQRLINATVDLVRIEGHNEGACSYGAAAASGVRQHGRHRERTFGHDGHSASGAEPYAR
jgi:glutathione synthase/RimK-type ligase-like ATP-grasp enzyme